MASSLSLFSIGRLVLVFCTAHSTLAQNTLAPPCLSACMESNPANHAPDTCTDTWLASLSSCIDVACPATTMADDDVPLTNYTLMQFAPKLAYPCEQSILPGDSSGDTGVSLPLVVDDCATSPYPFQSFIGTSNGTIGPRYVLQIYTHAACQGNPQNMSLGVGEFIDGACKFMQGQSVQLTVNTSYNSMSANQAAHVYLDSLCYQSNSGGYTGASSYISMIFTSSSATNGLAASLTAGIGTSTVTLASTTSTPATYDPSLVSNFTDSTVTALLSSNRTSNLTITTMSASTSTTYTISPTTSVPWNVHFKSAAPKPSVPLFITMMSSIAIVLLSGGLWDRDTNRYHKVVEQKD